MRTQFIRVSPIPIPLPGGQERAFEYHVSRYQQWLSTAGASPRIAIGLCAQETALQTCLNQLELREIEVKREIVDIQRAIPTTVLRHQGNHFNRTLFVLDGLQADPNFFNEWTRMWSITAKWPHGSCLWFVTSTRCVVLKSRRREFGPGSIVTSQ